MKRQNYRSATMVVAMLALIAAPSLCAFDSTPYPGPNPPDGSAAHPWKIDLPEDFDAIGTDATHLADHHYVVTKDIDCGNQDHRIRMAFTGSLDGEYHTISNILADQPAEENVGLFKDLGSGAIIRRLAIVDSYFRALRRVAPFGSMGSGSRVEECLSQGNTIISVSTTGQPAGGIVSGGSNQPPYAVVINSYSRNNSVTSSFQTVGGISGYHDARVERCYSAGCSLTAPKYVGGLVGYGISTGAIVDSYSDATNSHPVQVGYFSGSWQNTLVPSKTATDVDLTQYSIVELNWDPAVWAKGADNLPFLIGFVNQAPVADAGADQWLLPGTTAYLDASGTTDDYTAVSELDYAWTIESAPTGSTAVLTGADTVAPSFDPDLLGDYTIQLTVTDYGGLQGVDEVTVSVLDMPEIVVEQPVGTNLIDGVSDRDLGDAPLGLSTPPMTFTIFNNGTLDLTGLAITVDGAHPGDFIVSGPGSTTVAPGANTSFTVTFTPAAAGSRSAVLHLGNDDLDENPFDIVLTGNGGGEVDPGFGTSCNGEVYTLAVQPDGKILIGGDFGAVNGESRSGIARLNADGTLDMDFNPYAYGRVLTMALQADGRMIIGGWFYEVGGVPRDHLARLHPDGTVEAGFDPGVNGNVHCMAVQDDGKILIGGDFNEVGGITRQYIARLNADGSPDNGFNPGANDRVESMAVQPDGKILLGGRFTTVGGATRNYIARLNADGTLDTGFSPTADNWVYCMVVQADGEIVIGGEFTSVNGVPRNRIARLNADGTPDPDFDPDASSWVASMALQADGKIVIGGQFWSIGGTTRNHIARINSDGTLETGFNPDANGWVYGTALQADGQILIGGEFTSVGGTGRDHIARLLNGPASQSLFIPGAGHVVWQRAGTTPETLRVSFEASEDGTTWRTIGDGTRITGGWELTGASLPAAGTLRARARTSGAWNNGGSGMIEQQFVFSGLPVAEIAVEQPGGTDLVDGTASLDFGDTLLGFSGATKTFVVKNHGAADLIGLAVSADGDHPGDFSLGTLGATTLAPGANTSFTVTFAPTVAGARSAFLRIASNDFDESPFDIELTGTGNGGGNVDPTFDPNANGEVYSMAVQPNGKTVIAGTFTSVGGAARNRVARLNSDGRVDPGFNPNANGPVHGTAIQTDGKILIGGGFTVAGGKTRNHLARLHPDGSLDTAFNPDVDDFVSAMAIQPDGKIVLAGGFTTVDGTARNSIARLNPDGSLDTGFDPDPNDLVYSVALQTDGRIVIGGWFTTVSGMARNSVARLLDDGSPDPDFNPYANAAVYCTSIQADGKIVIGGYFTWVGDSPRYGIARLLPDGTVDPGFDPDTDDSVLSIATQANGQTLIGGYFTWVDGEPRNGLARINADGTLDTDFDPVVDDFVYSTALQADGRILVGGPFAEVGGTPRNSVARLMNIAAPQIINLPNSSRVEWQRGGSAPDTTQVSFEFSTSGSSWTALGAGTPVSGAWELSGLSLPSNGIIRARAHPTGGLYSGSAGLVEQQAVFHLMPEIAVEQPAGNDLIDGSSSVDFGSARVGTSSSASTFTIVNQGTADLTGLAVVVSGWSGEFTVVPPPVTSLAPGGSTTFMVTFNPSFPGLRAASLYIDSNDSDENPFDVALVGTGTGDGGVDPDFDPGADGQVAATAVQPDGKFLLGGDFTSIDGTARNHLARLNADGTLDPGFNPDANDGVQSIAVQADGKCLMGGLFTTVGGTPRNHLARLNANGSLDATFDPGVDGTVYCIALQTDEKIVIAGAFTTAAATGRNHVARLNTDGTLDTTFDPDTNGTVFSMMVQPDGKILIGGDFTVVDGTSRNHIARLNADGSLDTGFNPDVNSRVSCMALQADGKILVGGQFEFVGGDWHRSFARLNPDGSLDNEVQVDVEVSAFSMALQVDGKILIGGEFWGVGGYSRGNLARLNANGTLDQSFNPSADAPVYGVTLQADGGLVIGGQFTEIDGTPRNRLARLLNDASSQSLSVPSSSQVVWQRDGTAPETTRVTFDLSTDGSNWTPLGEGTRISGGWELTSLSLPESGTIRARARTHGGQYGGSSGLIEQQAAFSPMPEIAIEQPAGTDLVDGSSTIDCGAVVLGTSGALKTFTIINQGEADLTGIAVTLGGDHPGDFQVDDPGASALAPGASTTFHVAFVPTALGTRAAVLHLGSNDSDENPFDIHLTGTATGDGLEEPDFCPSVDGPVYSMAVQMDGKVLIGGQFNSVGGEARANFARLNADGTPDAGFAPEVMGIDDPSSAVYGTAVQDDGKIVIGGQFITVDGTARNNLARLAADGSLDTGFNPEVNGIIHCMALQADGKILIAGGFTGIGGTPRNRIARLHADGTVDAGFNPNTDGPVRSMALQPDGRIVIGGEFMSVGGASHDFLARLNGDGTPDTGFNPDVNEMVYVTALQPDGKILIGGAFIEIGSEWRPGFARLHQDGTLDDDFNTEMDGYVSSIVLQADGDIVIGGDFSVVGGYPSFRIARLNTNGGLDLDFNPWTWVWEPVSSLALQADGQLLIGSYFDFEGGEPQNHLARALNGAASRILTVPNAARVEWQRDGTTPEAIQVIFEFSTAGLNWSYLGEGTRVTGAWELTGLSLPSNGWIRALARISSGQSNGSSGLIAQQVAFSGLAPALPEIAVEQPVGIELEDGEGVFLGNLPVGTNGNPRTFTITNRGALDLTGLAVTADGLHPGDFIVSGLAATTLAPDASTTFNVTFTPNASGSRSASLHIASNDSDENPFDIPLGGFGASVGTADGDFQLWLEADAGIYSTTVQADGSILIGGDIWWVGGREQYGLARLNDEGSVDTSFNPHISDHPVVLCSAMQPDGRILIGGWISTVGGMTRNGIARLNANGTLDTGFNPDANGSVSSMAVQADGRILIAGGFTTVGGTPRSHLARLNPDGTLDTGFNPEPDNSLFALALQADGKIVIGGTFESVGGTNRHRIARLNADGTLDAGFDPNVDGGVDASVLTLVVQADGRILAGGDFDSVGGTECANLARLNADGTLDCGFHPCPNSRVLSLALQADGRIVMAGEFNGVGGTPRNFIARLNSSGSLDTGFDPQPDSVVYSVALQPDGRIVLGGEFSMVGDTWSPRVTRLLNDPSVQSLTVPNTTRVQWQRAGSAPETTQVTFELSTDGTIWTNLGNGTRVSSAWELTGLSLPASGMVRARARTTCGQYNGSSGLVEQLVTYPAPEIAVEQPVGNELVDGTARYDFGNVRVGTGSQALSFTISNRGINDLTGLATALEGQMAADFEVEGPDVTTLASGTDTTITIVFTPAALGTRNVVLHIASNDTDENPFDIVLTGKGVPEGGVETNFDPTANWSVYTAAMQADGKIVIAGGFTAIDGTARNRIARLHADGSLDPGFDPDVNGTVYSTAVQADGKIVIAGGFTRVGGTARNSIARLNPDGSLDPTFDPDVDDAVYCTALQPDGKIVIGGWFTGVGGMPRNSIARLNADGTLDTAFDPDADLAVYSAVVQPDGRILIGGWFTSVSGTPRDCIARLHSDGSLDNGFDTDADDAVLVMVLQSDGEILIGGDFTTIDGTPRNHIARLHADGTLDTGFDPDAGDSVGSIALQADGRIVIGGYFTIVAGTGRNYIARLNANGTLDEGFDPDADYYVYGTAIEAGGTILIGGAFSSVGGTPRNSIARLLNGPSWQSLSVPSTAHVAWHRAGTAPEATRVTFDHSIDGIDWTPLGQGTRVSGGWELTGLSLPASGTIRARARTTGGLYNGSSGWVEQRTNYPVPEIAVEQPAGTNLIDGAATIDFGNVVLGTSGTARTFIITNTGTTDLSGLAITMDGDHPGDFAVGTPATTTLTPGTSTTFTVTFSPVNPGTRNAVLHLASNDADENPFDIALTGAGTMDGNPDSGFKPNVNGGILGTAVQPDGKILIAGQFTSVGGIPRNHIARLHADGTLDADFNPDANENVCNIAVQADGKIVIVGFFTTVDGTPRNRIARLHADGSLDARFDPNPNSIVYSTALQADGKIVIGGWFTTVGGTIRNRIARLHADGTLDSGFTPPDIDNTIYSMALQADGKVVIGGWFTTVGGTQRNRIARLHADGSLDISFDPDASEQVFSMAMQADGKILIGGQFTAVGGLPRNHIARLHPDGTLDNSFDPNPDGGVYGTAIQSDGKILLGGDFTTIGGTARACLARLHADGTPDPGFNPNVTGGDAWVMMVALQADGEILIGGSFGSVNGTPRNSMARLLNGPATQTLSVPSVARVDWQRGGTSPETSQVTFDLSTDGTLWTTLGFGSRISGGWELTGLSLPASGTIRARARTAGGEFNGSSGLVEQQLAFTDPPLAAPEIVVDQVAYSNLVDGVSIIDFGEVKVGESTGAMAFTISNEGDANLTGLAITTDGSNSGDFTLVGPESTSLAPGASTTFSVTFTPTASGSRSAAFHLVSNDSDESPFDIGLSGTGLTALEAWRLANFGISSNTGEAANTADADHDGVCNLFEFAFDLDPHANSANLVPQWQLIGNNLICTFTRPAGVSGITYGAEWSPSMAPGSWLLLANTGTDPGYTFSLPIDSIGRKFVRLVISAP